MLRASALIALVALGGVWTVAASAQVPPTTFDQTGVADTSVFAPLSLPPGTDTRSASGAPGPHYWQNQADYDIKATLDTAAQTLRGALRLRYTNHSPDTLQFLWIQVEQNYYAPSALHTLLFPAGRLYGSRDFEGGEIIDRIEQVGARGRRRSVDRRVQDTEMQLWLPTPVAPGTTTIIDVAWHFRIPTRIRGDRMGRDGALYELALWFPRVNVYDDLRGWNTEPYLGPSEFYLEYGNFQYAVTVPAGYIVAGTGMLANPQDVLTATERRRLAAVPSAASPVAIVTAEELASGVARPRHAGTLTWRFRADHVRDVAWAAAPDYRWDAVGWHGIIAQAFYRSTAPASWQEAAAMARTSIEEYGTRWYSYPYPQITAVEGPVDGMEYPMLAMESAYRDPHQLYGVITHEVGHNWFPMLVGSNERMHAWMDEGFNTFMNSFAEAHRYPDQGDQATRIARYRDMVVHAESAGTDDPIETPHDRESLARTDLTFYYKPAVGLELLRREILGPDAFDAAFRTYIQRWAYKHPAPADFFRTMENVSGRRLGWFWREFWLQNYHFDQAIDSVSVSDAGDTTLVMITYANRGRGVLPILARFTLADGSTADYAYPAEVWSANATRYHRQYRFVNQRVTRIELDPDHRLLDINRGNNVWTP